MRTAEPFCRYPRSVLPTRVRVDRRSLVAAFGLLVVLGAGAPRIGSAQIPDEFHNLQVLPEEIEKPQLVGIMRGFAMGLGVRCWYCHVGEEGMPFSEFDFESDEKLTKKKARFMLEMTQYLDEERLPGLTEVGDRADLRDPPASKRRWFRPCAVPAPSRPSRFAAASPRRRNTRRR